MGSAAEPLEVLLSEKLGPLHSNGLQLPAPPKAFQMLLCNSKRASEKDIGQQSGLANLCIFYFQDATRTSEKLLIRRNS